MLNGFNMLNLSTKGHGTKICWAELARVAHVSTTSSGAAGG